MILINDNDGLCDRDRFSGEVNSADRLSEDLFPTHAGGQRETDEAKIAGILYHR